MNSHILYPNVLRGAIINGSSDVPNQWVTSIQSILEEGDEDGAIDKSYYYLSHECRLEDVPLAHQPPLIGIMTTKSKAGGIGEWLTYSFMNKFYAVPSPGIPIPKSIVEGSDFREISHGVYEPIPFSRHNWISEVRCPFSPVDELNLEDAYTLVSSGLITPSELCLKICYLDNGRHITCYSQSRYVNFRNPYSDKFPKYIQPISGQVLLMLNGTRRVGYIAMSIPISNAHEPIVEFMSRVWVRFSVLKESGNDWSFLGDASEDATISIYGLARKLDATVSFYRYADHY